MKQLLAGVLLFGSSFAVGQTSTDIPVQSWISSADRTMLLKESGEQLSFTHKAKPGATTIVVDEKQQFQSMDGFGFAITGGTAELLMKMSAVSRTKTLKELFGTGSGSSGISYLRLSIGASDLNSFVFSYNDLPAGQTDMELKKFSLSQDLKDVVPVMKEILTINPDIRVMGSPWSAPVWMKTNDNIRGGALKKECYDVYARYLVKYIEEMKKQGIRIDAITVQNEPLNSRNTPSMQWLREEQGAFIKNHLGPAFQKKSIQTKIVLFDHNCDRIDYPLALLSDPDIAQYVDGSGFHHYGGDLSAMNTMHLARPDKNIYFTEQMIIERDYEKQLNITGSVKRMLISTTRNWSKNVILWNLAADPNNDPHTDNGGCSMCQGALTIDGDRVKKNLAYYTIAHASQFVPAGSVRIASTNTGDKVVVLTQDEERAFINRVATIDQAQVFPNVAFKTTTNKIVLVVVNDSFSSGAFSVQYHGKIMQCKLAPGSVGTYVWNTD
ncbi:glycoside hydrolase family 30 protein [Flavihumibacter sp. UBA7668]|uniref:glycoside hydrolase family 30 protein n=1 Tax=Flavihumibacter sp. UBA7668 TaxID=1946542 RepID=UPI0025C579C0|nr:glycoside hydrolase family 30 beta sandwich domain-containing protein [Flavihumibacter sp. UBA7668]